MASNAVLTQNAKQHESTNGELVAESSQTLGAGAGAVDLM